MYTINKPMAKLWDKLLILFGFIEGKDLPTISKTESLAGISLQLPTNMPQEILKGDRISFLTPVLTSRDSSHFNSHIMEVSYCTSRIGAIISVICGHCHCV